MLFKLCFFSEFNNLQIIKINFYKISLFVKIFLF